MSNSFITGITTQEFDTLPPRTRRGGGGGRKAEHLERIRNASPGELVRITVEAEGDDEFNRNIKSLRSGLSRKGALGDQNITTRVNQELRSLDVFILAAEEEIEEVAENIENNI